MCESPVDLRARRRRVWGAVDRGTLAEENQLSVTVEVGGDQELRLAQREAADPR